MTPPPPGSPGPSAVQPAAGVPNRSRLRGRRVCAPATCAAPSPAPAPSPGPFPRGCPSRKPDAAHPRHPGPHRGPHHGHRARLLAARRSQEGFQLLELVVVLLIFALLATLVTPPLLRASADLRVRLAATELAGVLRRARALAVTRSANVAVKFRATADGRVTYTLYRDGDGDGVRNRDIDRGIDPPLGHPRRLAHMGASVGFGIPGQLRPRSPGSRRRLGRLHDPIRFNRSDLASFSPLGSATPGSLYLTDGRDRLAVVRVFHRSGRVRILTYDPRTETWD